MTKLQSGTRLGRYELLLPIGEGGMAVVWVAREYAAHRANDRVVALKVMLPELTTDADFVAMFLDEGRLVQAIRHPHVVEVYELGFVGGWAFLAMEWVEGESLHTLIAEAGKRRPIPFEMAARVIADVASGLHAAHELRDERGDLLGVVHRDVSPHNILVGADGRVRLVDFGVAKARERLGGATVVGHVKGKLGYMSPEQALGRPVDRRSDVFSLGIVLYELTTGKRLFRGEDEAETLDLVVDGEVPAPTHVAPDYPPLLEAIVMKALSRSRRGRFQTARDLQAALEGYLRDQRVVVPRAGVAALLKRVLGERIEARHCAVRAAFETNHLGADGPAFQSRDRADGSGVDDPRWATGPTDHNNVPSEPLGSVVPAGGGSYAAVAVGLLLAALLAVLYLVHTL